MRKTLYFLTLAAVFSLASFAYAMHPVRLCPAFTRTLVLGSRGEDIKMLQSVLSGDPGVYPERFITGYFGKLTEKAVQRFQAKYGVISLGSPATTGYGAFGPRTRAKLKEICEKMNFAHEEVARPREAPPPPPTPAPIPPTQPTIPETAITPMPPPPGVLAPPPVVLTGSYEGTTCSLDVEPKILTLGANRAETTWTVNSSPTGWHFYWHEIVNAIDQGDFYGGTTNKSKLETYAAVPAKYTRYAHVVIEQNHLVGTSHSNAVCITKSATFEIQDSY